MSHAITRDRDDLRVAVFLLISGRHVEERKTSFIAADIFGV